MQIGHRPSFTVQRACISRMIFSGSKVMAFSISPACHGDHRLHCQSRPKRGFPCGSPKFMPSQFLFLGRRRIPTNWSSGRPSWGMRPWRLADHNTWPASCGPCGGKQAGINPVGGNRPRTLHRLSSCQPIGCVRPAARIITEGCRRANKGACRLAFDDLARHAEGLLGCVLPEPGGGAQFRRALSAYRELFGDRCYLAASLHYGPDDARRLAELCALARLARVPLVASGAVRYHAAERQALQDVLTAVRHRTTVAGAAEHLFANAERYLKPPEQVAALFAGAADAVHRTLEIAGRIGFARELRCGILRNWRRGAGSGRRTAGRRACENAIRGIAMFRGHSMSCC